MLGAGITGEIEKDAGGVFFLCAFLCADIITGRGITGVARNSGGAGIKKGRGQFWKLAILEAVEKAVELWKK